MLENDEITGRLTNTNNLVDEVFYVILFHIKFYVLMDCFLRNLIGSLIPAIFQKLNYQKIIEFISLSTKNYFQ